jgi:CubicO group peptidase (beta-lactamase class C family)
MSSESLSVSVESQLDAFFGQYTAANQARGLVYGLVGPDGLRHSRGFGVAGDDGEAPDVDTVFPIASMTKSFVAAGALLARDRGLVNLEAPITDFFEEFRAGGTFDDPCDAPSLRMLFSMSGGLTEDNSWVDPFIDTPVSEILDRIKGGLTYSWLPGTTFEYSNLGYTLAGLAVGKAVGRRIEDWVTDEIIRPLGMTRTWFDNDAPPPGEGPRVSGGQDRRATGYSLDEAGEWVGYPPAVSDAFAAAGGMQSTVRDLAVWVTWLGAAFRPPVGNRSAADGPSPSIGTDGPSPSIGTDGPLRRASRREMQRLHALNLPAVASRPDGSFSIGVGGYGLGLVINEDLNRGTMVWHSGGLPGFLLNMTWHPDSGHGMVVLTNSHRGNPIALSIEGLQRVLDRESAAARTVRLWPSTVELRQSAERLIRVWDDELAGQILAENIEFDRPVAQRRAEIEQLVAEIGPLGPPRPLADVASAATPADVTWVIPGERGELVCMIHLTPVEPARIQQFEVQASHYDRPRAARPSDISPRRRGLGQASLSSLPNVRVVVPEV